MTLWLLDKSAHVRLVAGAPGRVPWGGGNSVRQRSRSSGVSFRFCGWAIA